MLRYLFIFNYAKHYYTPLVLTLCVVSIFVASMLALRQNDMKKIVAYSSIAHMNFAIVGIFSNNFYGVIGGILLMISHGVVSAAMFFIIGILYDRYHTRNIWYYGGIVQVMPLFSTFFFLFTISNFSFPGTSNFLGEILIIISIGSHALTTMLVVVTISTFFGLLYSILMFNRVVFGNLSYKYIQSFSDVDRRELYIISSLFFVNVAIGFSPNEIISTLYFTIKVLCAASLPEGIHPKYEGVSEGIK